MITGINDLATSRPDLVKYFCNKEDAYTHTIHSSKKVRCRCVLCGTEKEMTIHNLQKYGIMCTRCGNGVSYNERFFQSFLEQIKLNYTKQYKISGYKFRYDFYAEGNIIEIHGGQHYSKSRNFFQSYKEVHDNDLLKYDIAVINNFEINKNFFIIDCSERENIIKNIKACLLFKDIDFKNIDWEKCDKDARKSIQFEIIKYKKENPNSTTKEIAEIFNVSRDSVVNYLNFGNEVGLIECNLLKEKIDRMSNKVILVKPDGTRYFEKAMSQGKLYELTGITIPCQNGCIRSGKPLTSRWNAKYDKKYKGCYIKMEDDEK